MTKDIGVASAIAGKSSARLTSGNTTGTTEVARQEEPGAVRLPTPTATTPTLATTAETAGNAAI